MGSRSRRSRSGGFDTSALGVLACLTCCVLVAGPSRAQSLTDGPLAAPGTGTPAPREAPAAKSATRASRKPATKTHTANRSDATKATDAIPADLGGSGPGASRAAKPAPRQPPAERASDPLSLGMKWNGSNDSPEQTRIQNYGGTAAGTGASVGLNYHF